MLTVKHIHSSGAEDLYPSPTVRYSPGEDNQTHGHPATVWITKADGFEFPLTGGNIFVMNDLGKTVARYNLTPGEFVAPAAPEIDARAVFYAACKVEASKHLDPLGLRFRECMDNADGGITITFVDENARKASVQASGRELRMNRTAEMLDDLAKSRVKNAANAWQHEAA